MQSTFKFLSPFLITFLGKFDTIAPETKGGSRHGYNDTMEITLSL